MKKIHAYFLVVFSLILASCQFDSPYSRPVSITMKSALYDSTVDYAKLSVIADGVEVYSGKFTGTTTATVEVDVPLYATVDFVWSEYLDQATYDADRPWMVARTSAYVDQNLTTVDIEPFRIDISAGINDWLGTKFNNLFGTIGILNTHGDFSIDYADDQGNTANSSGSSGIAGSTLTLPYSYYYGSGSVGVKGSWTITDDSTTTKTIYYHYNLSLYAA